MRRMCPGKLFLCPNSLYSEGMPFQGGGMQSCSSLGITSLCWPRCLCCPWHPPALFFSITLGVPLAAAGARCRALASFPAEPCEGCVKSFLAEALHFAWLCFASPRFAPHPFLVYHLLIHKQAWGIQLHGLGFAEKAAHLRHTKSPVSARVRSISDVLTGTWTFNEFVILYLGSTAAPCTPLE